MKDYTVRPDGHFEDEHGNFVLNIREKELLSTPEASGRSPNDPAWLILNALLVTERVELVSCPIELFKRMLQMGALIDWMAYGSSDPDKTFVVSITDDNGQTNDHIAELFLRDAHPELAWPDLGFEYSAAKLTVASNEDDWYVVDLNPDEVAKLERQALSCSDWPVSEIDAPAPLAKILANNPIIPDAYDPDKYIDIPDRFNYAIPADDDDDLSDVIAADVLSFTERFYNEPDVAGMVVIGPNGIEHDIEDIMKASDPAAFLMDIMNGTDDDSDLVRGHGDMLRGLLGDDSDDWLFN